jgi:fructokinase
MAEIVCLGEALIDFVAAESGVGVGEASSFLRAPGGAPANVAVGVARLGHACAFLGKVGDDPFGRFLQTTFAAAGVDTGGMVFDPVHRTGLAFVSLEANGERDFCFFRNPSADMTYAPAELDLDRIRAGRIFHYGSITLIDQPARSTTLAAIETARAAGLLLSYDPNLRPPLWPSLAEARATILDTIPHAHLVKLNEEELVFLMTEDDALPVESLSEAECRTLARNFRSRFPSVRLLAVTRGAKGSFVAWGDDKSLSTPGLPVKPVDTTGAGDGFVAALLSGLLERALATPEALADPSLDLLAPIVIRANAVGALTTTRKGAIPALPTPTELDAFLRIL